ncbi:protein of unknown function [Thermomonospora echinospora]|uniref:DUF397 domain-containing protein n=1 Tax=Thermomonospora echinospora TaxID=1992 RepID=A0A1H6DQU8_9ACTN|nr:DUF397 domain-containing protein [Thermomonospora echinospora]SEG87464.1 protein of unknown function [Thermomonospora echinospora]
MANRDRSFVAWRKSSHSNGGGECVEVAAAHGMVAIRDSKAPKAPHLVTTAQDWRSLLSAVKRGMLDR